MSYIVLGAGILFNSLLTMLPKRAHVVSQVTQPFSDEVRVTVKLATGGNFAFTSAKPELATYEAGMSVNLIVAIRNNGTYEQFNCVIYDDDTGAQLVGFGDYMGADSDKAYIIYVGTMLARDWNLRLTVAP